MISVYVRLGGGEKEHSKWEEESVGKSRLSCPGEVLALAQSVWKSELEKT